MANLLTSGTLYVNIGNLGGRVNYTIDTTGKITAKFEDMAPFADWKTQGGNYPSVNGIIAEYDGKEYQIGYSESYYGQTVAIDLKREKNEIRFWGMHNLQIAGLISEFGLPDWETESDKAPTSVTAVWDVPNTAPTATISATTPFAGKANKVSWKISDADGDRVKVVRLVRYYRPAGGTTFSGTVVLADSTATSYNDTIPTTYGGGSVYYEISFEDTYGGSGTAQTSTVKVLTNTAPTIPGVPILPDVISGGAEITVTWDKSTDADGNLEGYKLERSIDGGASWTQVYQGSKNSAGTPVPAGVNSIIYRVKAYDSYGAESGYAATAEYMVINNAAPAAPETLTVPALISNGASILISWAASTDADGENVSYELDRSVDGGVFENIYAGAARNHTDTIEAGWLTVRYRVCAVDDRGAKSEYTVSEERNIVSNYAPTVEIVNAPAGMDYGIISDALTVTARISDKDDTNLTVNYKIDGVTAASDSVVTNGSEAAETSHSFDSNWYRIPNGVHVLTVEVTDGTAVSSADLRFTKENKDAVVTLAVPMTASEKITVCVISIGGKIPEDADITVEVTNNANDSSPVWEDATAHALSGMNHAFSNGTQSNGWAFNFRVTVHGGDIRGYITSIQGGFQ